jgi:hypothetical protein
MGVPPILGRAVIVDGVDQECSRWDFEAGKAARPLVHRGIGDPNPALDGLAAPLLVKPGDAASIDADPSERLARRTVQNRIRLRPAAGILAFVENDDVRAPSSLRKQFLRVGLSPAEGDDRVTRELADAGEQVMLPLVERAGGSEAKPVDGEAT